MNRLNYKDTEETNLHNYKLVRVTEIRENGDFPKCMLRFDMPGCFPKLRLGKRVDWSSIRHYFDSNAQEYVLRDAIDINGVIQIITTPHVLYVIKSPVFGWRKIFARLRWIFGVYDYGFLAHHTL